ncbi:LysR substrate-binding domain-containing protein [Phyllobacterium salinisoli]|uniref:LysR substrate-binding domain-containing protein n=1 Tax=Phyllobacterium salinisoli TaxID=1899321 RepID=UPI003CCAF0F2
MPHSVDFIAVHGWKLLASKCGAPVSTNDLVQHICLPLFGMTHWTFISAGRERQVRLSARFSSSTIQGYHATCLAGGGIALLAVWSVEEDSEGGSSQRIDLGRMRCPGPINMGYPSDKQTGPAKGSGADIGIARRAHRSRIKE